MDSLFILLGRFHPLIVHLPIGILILLALLELVGCLPWAPRLSDGLRTLVLVIGAGSAAFAALFGWWLARDGGYDPTLLFRHRYLGSATAALVFVLLGVHLLHWRRIYAVTGVITIGALSVAGHFGGSLTHGEGYLALPKPKKVPMSDPAQAVIFNDLVQPIFAQKCYACHGPSKSNGDLRYDSWDALVKGGKSGPSFKAGDSAASRMIQRAHLPLDSKEHMPPKGKPQLTDNELSIVEWWIDLGAPKDQKLTGADLPPTIIDALAPQFPSLRPPVPDRAASLVAANALEKKLAIPIRPLAIESPFFRANARLSGTQFGDAQLAELAPIALAIQSLDLGETSVTDAGLTTLAEMKNLRRLSLDRTAVTDDGLKNLLQLKGLEYLNLHTTAITDRGLASLKVLSRLRSLYLWQTKVTPAAVEVLSGQLVDVRRVRRIEDQIAQLQNEMRSQQFNANLGTAKVPAVEPVKPAPEPVKPEANLPSTPATPPAKPPVNPPVP